MAVKGTFRHNTDHEARYAPSTDMEPGEIRQLPDGRACINNSNQTIKANTEGRVQTHGLVEATTDGAITIADGDDVFIDADAWAPAQGGGFKVGKARRGGVAAPATRLFVALNAPN